MGGKKLYGQKKQTADFALSLRHLCPKIDDFEPPKIGTRHVQAQNGSTDRPNVTQGQIARNLETEHLLCCIILYR